MLSEGQLRDKIYLPGRAFIMGRSAAIVGTGTMELHQSHFPFGRIPLHSNSWILASANSMRKSFTVLPS